ncbi:T9SS type A sorting domain-containing protein [Flavihumibacter solisilvae]|uniref:Secretion system C-terminal sorting domain-containing protein n=1 Tax=Flavihumibacter solisilvae TaxID=1349421 RepID=A0A0C1LHH5_9BACT|nr:T9SS type A sorting domain-containing protein [Flavihumibacter solisilvae]KIC94798.1 hypothetical protein OI18_10010 [Flavihumibacter solisilvae]
MKHFLRNQRIVLNIALSAWCVGSFPGLLFSQATVFPKDYQLYPRNLTTNLATVRVQGTINQSSGYTQVRLKRYRDGSFQNTTTVNLQYNNGVAAFDFTNEIPAELNNYRFSLYGYKSFTETLLQTANNVVAGDAYIIQGQSNAVANLRGSYSSANNADDPNNAPNRSFVRVYGSGSTSGSYSKAWFIGKGNVWYDVDGQTGQWGMRLASDLATSRRIPICIINGGNPGQRITYFQRNDGNPGDPSTNYGRVLNRIREAGLQNNIRAIIWHQGESDIQGSLSPVQLSTDQYKSYFHNLMNDWKSDFPSLNKFYLFQIRYGCGMSSADNCLKIQEAQRQLDKESSEVVTLGTSNSSQLFDGGSIRYCHYNFYDGYKNFGDWVSLVIRRDLYGESGLPATIESPEPQSATFSVVSPGGVASQVSLALKDQGSAFTISGDLSGLIRLNGGSYAINSVSLSGNNLLVNFTRGSGVTTNPTSISYRGHDQVASPQVVNSGGLGLINFDFIPIDAGSTPPPPPTGNCTDLNEPNNSFQQTKTLNHNTDYTGSIASVSDEDWFSFRTWAPYKNVKISLWNMPEDYDMYLYDQNGVLLTSATGTGTSEALIYNNGPDNFNYRLKIISKDGRFNPDVCYSLRLQASAYMWPLNSPPYASTLNKSIVIAKEVKNKMEKFMSTTLKVFPNPAREKLHINYHAKDKCNTEFRITDITGKEMIYRKVKSDAGNNQYKIDISKLGPGTYMLQMRTDYSFENCKIIVLK